MLPPSRGPTSTRHNELGNHPRSHAKPALGTHPLELHSATHSTVILGPSPRMTCVALLDCRPQTPVCCSVEAAWQSPEGREALRFGDGAGGGSLRHRGQLAAAA